MAKNPQKQARGEIGVSAISDFGIVREREYNKQLRGKKKFEIYEMMSSGDGTVQGILSAMSQPLLRANWSIDPGKDKRVDRKVAEFVQVNIMEGMTRSWKQTLEEILNYLPLGVMPFELVFDLNKQKQFYLRKLSIRHPSTIDEWVMENGEEGIHQYTGSEYVDIPLWKLVMFVNKRLGDSWEGKSVLRAGYKHWDYKNKYYNIDAIATERLGLGIPIGTMNAGATQEQIDEFETILANIRVNEKAAIVKKEGQTIEMLDMKGHTIKDPENMINHHNRELAKMVLAQFIEIGVANNSGGYAQSRNETEFFTMILQSVADYICETFNEYVIRKLVDLNFQVEAYPKLTYDRIGAPDLSPWAKAIADLVNAQALTPDHNVESHIREVLELPEIGAVPLSDEMIATILQDITEAVTPSPKPLMASEQNTKKKLVDLKMEMERELLEMQSKGQTVTREDIAKFRLRYHDQKAKLMRNLPTDEPSDNPTASDDRLLDILEEVEHVRSSLKT